jgi:hypothetical protein
LLRPFQLFCETQLMYSQGKDPWRRDVPGCQGLVGKITSTMTRR